MIADPTTKLRRRIERYLRATGIAWTRFGREAMGDPSFVGDLRKGRTPRQETIDWCHEYLDRRDAPA